MDAIDGLFDDLETQRSFVAERAPVYARILELLPEVLPTERLEQAWVGRSFGAWYERPLLILAALRDDALEQGPDHPLYQAIGAEPEVGAVTVGGLRSALAEDRGLWRKLPSRHVQTNETSRAVAWLWPAHLLSVADPARPLQLVDIGASAGLNLVADGLPRIWAGADGTPLPIDPLPRVALRRGYDVRPLDLGDEADVRWLRACVWPGQGNRVERLEQAIAAWRSADPKPELVAASASEIPGLLPRSGRTLAFQTVVRDYLPPGERSAYEAGMRGWLAECPGAVWIELEAEPRTEGGPAAAITAHLGGASLVLATCEPHPVVLTVDEGAVRELQRLASGR